MIDPKSQPLRVTVEFTYDAEVYEDDPTDAFEIARLEYEGVEGAVESALGSVFGELKHLRVTIKPD